MIPNQTSCIVEFAAVPGAKDYRVYEPAHSAVHGGTPMYKYSGGGLRIEINGLNPLALAQGDFVIEAVDALGPYQRADANTPHHDIHHINGQGPSTNNPNILMTSATFRPRTAMQQWPTQPGATSLFRDTFEDTSAEATTFFPMPTPALTGVQAAMNLEFYGTWHSRFASKNWLIDFLGHERGTESIFIHQRHLMEILLDGERRNNNASSVLQPLVNGKQVEFDLADGKIVHITWEVDAHQKSRRWTELQLKPAEETFLTPGKFTMIPVWRRPTESGRLIRWQAQWEFHQLDIFREYPGDINRFSMEEQIIVGVQDPANERWDSSLNITRTRWDGAPLANGTMKDLDLRHKFDMYLSKNEYALYENGILIKRRAWKTPLPFTRMSAGFVHQVYHTEAEMPGAEGGEYYYQYINQSDEKHWNNFGIEIVPAFPR